MRINSNVPKPMANFFFRLRLFMDYSGYRAVILTVEHKRVIDRRGNDFTEYVAGGAKRVSPD